MIFLTCLGLTVALAASQRMSRAATPAAPTSVPIGSKRVPVDAAEELGRQMRQQASILAGYPLMGTRVRVWVRDGFQTGVPTQFEAPNVSGPNNFLYVGKVIAFDAHWVGLEADDGSRAWLPREDVAQVLQLAAPVTQPAH